MKVALPPLEALAGLSGDSSEVSKHLQHNVQLWRWINGAFGMLKDEAEGVARARIDSAFPLSEAQLADLRAALEKRFGKKVEATVAVDPALIGGVRITVGDTVIDGTVQAKLSTMAHQLRA